MSIIEVTTDTPESFRNKLYNIDTEGRRHKIYPHKPDGRFYRWRSRLSYLLLVFLFLAPFVKINGYQFMLFNIIERKFILFGVVFFPQDFYIVVLGILTLLVSIFLFTSILGRIWCGWLCPQTVFMEMLFRKIEHGIEGNAVQQRLLDNAKLSPRKVMKKALKHGIFFALSFAIGNTFLAYIIGSDALITIITSPPTEHLTGFVAMVLFSLVFYGVFARFREQACVVVCPYGRYQSALVDHNTIAITYDFVRGEPRSKFTRKDKEALTVQGGVETSAAASRGDCIDCHQCVNVCPTGIDIRNGIQLECVNCAACIDACDVVMDKIKKPRGLIRYASLESIRSASQHWLSTRVRAYIGVWLIVMSLFVYFFTTRDMVEVLVLRQAGTLAVTNANGDKVNFYMMNIINKNYNDMSLKVEVLEPKGASVSVIGDISKVTKVSEKSARLMLSIPADKIIGTDQYVRLGVFANGEKIKELTTRFLSSDFSSTTKE
ncbi:MAG: cytochrome c oxidase accessory protein CcoG [Candidatus Kapabacteria bacterium]|nr:cytochrome c oxidase accessory protein CcoG [Candidatus Kapabacteria bacterium]